MLRHFLKVRAFNQYSEKFDKLQALCQYFPLSNFMLYGIYIIYTQIICKIIYLEMFLY